MQNGAACGVSAAGGNVKHKQLKFSVLKLNPEDKKKIECVASRLGISMTQMIVVGALRATQMEIPPRDLSGTIQIRLPEPIHDNLDKISDKTNRPMTELITLGLEAAFNIKLEGNDG